MNQLLLDGFRPSSAITRGFKATGPNRWALPPPTISVGASEDVMGTRSANGVTCTQCDEAKGAKPPDVADALAAVVSGTILTTALLLLALWRDWEKVGLVAVVTFLLWVPFCTVVGVIRLIMKRRGQMAYLFCKPGESEEHLHLQMPTLPEVQGRFIEIVLWGRGSLQGRVLSWEQASPTDQLIVNTGWTVGGRGREITLRSFRFGYSATFPWNTSRELALRMANSDYDISNLLERGLEYDKLATEVAEQKKFDTTIRAIRIAIANKKGRLSPTEVTIRNIISEALGEKRCEIVVPDAYTGGPM